MQIEGALIREQGVEFAVVVVKKHVVDNTFAAQDAICALQPAFPGLPIILMAQDARGVPTYFGRKDIARFMANVPVHAIPWKRFTVS